MKYDGYLFDFDGTLADTGEGICKSVAYSLEKLGHKVPDESVLRLFVGPPLHDSFMEYCGLSEAEAEFAVKLYRERYVKTGLYESRIYPGVAQLLMALRHAGAYVAIASAKPQHMLEKLSEYYGIDDALNLIVGIGEERHSADKRDLIMRALPEGADASRFCMVGDRRYDMEAAKALGLTAIGADYGYSLPGELAASGADAVFDNVKDMSFEFLSGEIPRGMFITLEGSDGCGKSTQITMLKEWLTRRGYEVVLSREPGGCPISERIREVILSLDSRGMSDECEALLYAASRAEHVREVIQPALDCGKIVICDRFLDSSIAYQAYGRELGEIFIRQINETAIDGTQPDLTLLLEVDRTESRRRMSEGAPLDRLEIEKEDFFSRVQAGYDALARSEPDRICRIDASKSIEGVFQDIQTAVKALLNN